jgi:hypothetical protein
MSQVPASLQGGQTRRRLATVLLSACLVLVALPATAVSAPSPKKAIWGPVTRNGVSQFPIYRDLGAGIYLTDLNWAAIAPSRPRSPKNPADRRYHWPAELDYAIREGRRYGIQVAIVLSGAPRWANGHRDWRWAPRRPSDFARFAYAASRRYRSVRHWMIWGEPTRRRNFQPLLPERRGHPLTRRMRRGPHIYAQILDSAYAALKRRSRRNLVIGGDSFTTGDVSPLNWIKNLRLPDGRPPRMDMYGHNPFTARRPLLGGPPLGDGFADFCDLPRLARWVDRYLGRPRGRRRMKLFLSEFFWPTDHPNHEFNFWVDRSTAAVWLSDALRGTRSSSRIYTLGWFSLYDDRPRPGGDEVNRGLLTFDGQKKPAYFAYQRG